MNISGEGGIRTLGRISPTPVFETGPIGHSGTSPKLRTIDPGHLGEQDKEWAEALPLWFTPFREVSSADARKQFSAHIRNLGEEEAGSKSKVLTAGELIDLFLDWRRKKPQRTDARSIRRGTRPRAVAPGWLMGQSAVRRSRADRPRGWARLPSWVQGTTLA